MVLVKKGPFFRHFFLGNIGQENVFYDILEPKNVFPVYEKGSLKRQKLRFFQRG